MNEIVHCKECRFYDTVVKRCRHQILNTKETDFCSQAIRIESVLYCPHCHKTFNEYPNYCPDCGFHLEGLETKKSEDKGEISDGYHTFNQLYHQRAVLFAVIVNQNKEKAWKSYKHSDGKYCFDSDGEWFIVGVDTPEGSFTYHYAKEYWDMFHCEELEVGKEWDGHTEDDVTRLLTLEQQSVDIIKLGDVLPKKHGRLIDGDALELLCSNHKIANNYMNNGTPIISIGRDENGERIWESLFEQAPTIIEASKG